MPVRSLTTSVLKWPTQAEVIKAVADWASSISRNDSNIRKIGYRGSYANGNWGVGSDVDLIVIVESTPHDFLTRGRGYDATGLPVPADLLVYTVEEASHVDEAMKSTVWVYEQ